MSSEKHILRLNSDIHSINIEIVKLQKALEDKRQRKRDLLLELKGIRLQNPKSKSKAKDDSDDDIDIVKK